MSRMTHEEMLGVIREATTELRRLKEVERKYLELVKKTQEEERKQIGWIEREEGFYKLYAPPKGSIVTHAFILCKYCNGAIYHCMGPKYDAVCFDCYEKEPELR